ncbi:hypothetical protein Cgig2_023568 [Carnegiea gigantea]|uniref:Uncharacterized protein n=1 Tax=Carnegiea gigantea TaxID=171969 RepID=A0A9Q1GSE6_9CARY|nr:hypothetical protein Cgig2_023568 [Carnegiea gigantea]
MKRPPDPYSSSLVFPVPPSPSPLSSLDCSPSASHAASDHRPTMKLALWCFSRSRFTALPVSVDADYGLPDFLDCVLFVSTISLPADGKICSFFPSPSASVSGGLTAKLKACHGGPEQRTLSLYAIFETRPYSLAILIAHPKLTQAALIHDASFAFPKTSHDLLSHFKLPRLVFVPGVPQFPLGPGKYEGQIIVECKSTVQIRGDERCSSLLQLSPLHTAPYPWLIIRSISHFLRLRYTLLLPCVTDLPLNHCRSDGHLDVECKSSVQIGDDTGYSEPLQQATPRLTHYLWPIIRSINQIGVDSSLAVCFGAQVVGFFVLLSILALHCHIQFQWIGAARVAATFTPNQLVYEKLDRALLREDYAQLFPSYIVNNGPFTCSDHAFVLLNMEPAHPPQRARISNTNTPRFTTRKCTVLSNKIGERERKALLCIS